MQLMYEMLFSVFTALKCISGLQGAKHKHTWVFSAEEVNDYCLMVKKLIILFTIL